MKHVLRAALVLLVSVLASLVPISFAPSFSTTLYTIVGIFFSIGYSIVISFDLSEVTKESLVRHLREKLKAIERSFIAYFGIATAAFFVSDQRPPCIIIGTYHYSFMMLSAAASIFILVYLIINYSLLQKLRDEISDKIRAEKTKKQED